MAESIELKKIKKMYGERFMKLCRDLFPTILEKEGRLYEILSSSFSENSKTLYEDIVNAGLEGEFKNYIYSKIDVEDKDKKIKEEKTPYDLLKEAGYDLFECTTEKEIQKFKKYYAKGEELCTFNGGRLDRCVVFFAVKKDAEKIKRKDFEKPAREDEYGTSVIGIQFNRRGICTVSIKNRYNHTVNNPDATYGNDLDRIIPGLTQSFANLLLKRGLELNSTNVEKFSIPGYTVANDGKYYKYNMEINGRYYCQGNIIIENGQANKLENPERQVLIDYFILDMENKSIQLYDRNLEDSFIDDFKDIEKVEIVKDKEKGNGARVITIKKKNLDSPIKIEIDRNNQIIGYINKGLTQIGDCFLYSNEGIIELEMPALTQIGHDFLFRNERITELELLELTQVGDNFLYNNKGLTELELPELTHVGGCFLNNNKGLTELELPELTQVGDYFLWTNEGLTELELPKLTQVGNVFLSNNEVLTKLELPELTQVGNRFLYSNKGLTELELPELTQEGGCFLADNEVLTNLKLPKLTQVDDFFLYRNKGLTKLELPELTQVGDRFLANNERITELELPNINKQRRNINSQSIAKLDQSNKITTSEINWARKIIEKVKAWFKRQDNHER